MALVSPLTKKIAKHFPLHPSRQNTMASMILGVLFNSNVHHQSLARYVASPNPKAALRKVERFFVKNHCPAKIMPDALLKRLDLKENLISIWIEPTGNLAIRKSTTWC